METWVRRRAGSATIVVCTDQRSTWALRGLPPQIRLVDISAGSAEPSSLASSPKGELVVVDEVVAAAPEPEQTLRRATTHVDAGGRVAVVWPLDGSRRPRDVRLYGPAALLDVAACCLELQDLEVVPDPGLLVVWGTPSPDADARAAARTAVWARSGPAVASLMAAAIEQRVHGDEVGARLREEQGRSQALSEQVRDHSARITQLEEQREHERRKVGRRDAQIAEMEERLSDTEPLRRRIDELEEELALERWRRESVYAQRWWRLGEVLRSVKARPTRAPAALAEALRIVRDDTPRPQRPAARAYGGEVRARRW